MQKLEGGRLGVDSAVEAIVLGKAAAIPLPPEVNIEFYVLKHPHTQSLPEDEREFYRREQEFGVLAISAAMAEQAEQGFEQVKAAGEPIKGVKPETAAVFLSLFQRLREQSIVSLKGESPRVADADVSHAA